MYKQFIYLKNKEVKYEDSEVIYSDSILKPGFYELTYVQYPLYKVVVKTNDNSCQISGISLSVEIKVK